MNRISIAEKSGKNPRLTKEGKDLRSVQQANQGWLELGGLNHPPGAIFHFDASNEKISAEFFHYSTHHFSVAEAIELGRALNRLPFRLIVYGIAGMNFAYGQRLTPEVEEAIPEIIESVLLDLNIIRKQQNIPLSAGGFLF